MKKIAVCGLALILIGGIGSYAGMAQEEEIPVPEASEEPAPLEPVEQPWRLSSPEAPFEIEARFGYDKLVSNSNLSDWWLGSVEVFKSFENKANILGQVSTTRRFDLQDVDIKLAGSYPIIPVLTVSGEMTASPTHQILPTFTAASRLYYGFLPGLGAQIGARHMVFPDSNVTMGSLMVEYYLSYFRLAATGFVSLVHNAGLGTAALLTGSYYYSDENFVGLGASYGTELTRLPNRVMLSEVPSVFAYGRHWFTDHWALSYRAGWIRQGDSYSRFGGELGVRYRL